MVDIVQTKSICAIIPARGGSKGIKRKNLQTVGGVPIIVRTINAAKNSRYINRILVSTDDKDISKISKANSAEVIDRSKKLSSDLASSETVLLDVLQKLNEKESYVPDITVFLQCTSPFTISEDIDFTIELLINNNADSAFVASAFKHFLWEKNSKGELIGINHNEKHSRKRRQDIYTQYLEAGSVYVFLTKGFLKNENRFFGNISLYEIPQKRLFEIDTPSELKIANEIEKLLN